MAKQRKAQTHSAYWYGKKYGIVHSDETTYTGRYLDLLKMNQSRNRFFDRYCPEALFNPCSLAICIALDFGVMMREEVKKLKKPKEREKLKKTLQQGVRKILRPTYYEQEKQRRRELAAERRKLHRRTTQSPEPSPEEILDAWNRRKDSKEQMIILGGMLHDLECYVDNCLKIDDWGNIVGRRGGIRGWIRCYLPELASKYKTLMRNKAMAIKLRQATQTKDPMPTAKLLEKEEVSLQKKNPIQNNTDGKERIENHAKKVPRQDAFKPKAENRKSATAPECAAKLEYRNKVVARIFDRPENTFKSILDVLDDYLSPDKVFYDELSPRRVSRMV